MFCFCSLSLSSYLCLTWLILRHFYSSDYRTLSVGIIRTSGTAEVTNPAVMNNSPAIIKITNRKLKKKTPAVNYARSRIVSHSDRITHDLCNKNTDRRASLLVQLSFHLPGLTEDVSRTAVMTAGLRVGSWRQDQPNQKLWPLDRQQSVSRNAFLMYVVWYSQHSTDCGYPNTSTANPNLKTRAVQQLRH